MREVPPSRHPALQSITRMGRCVDKPVEAQSRTDIKAILADGKAAKSSWLGGRNVRWAALAAMAALAAALAWSWGGRNSAVTYVTGEVTRGELIVVVTASGSVQPTNKVDVSSELSGTVRKVHVDFNSVVKAGEVLAELDTDKLKATLDSSRAKLAAARSKVADAQATVVEKQLELARKKSLASKKISSAHDLEAAQAAYDRAMAGLKSAQADVGVAEADLQINETNLAKASILSPIAGVVLKRSVDPGQTVASSLQAPVLFSIAEDLKQMELQVDVDEADVGKVKVGQIATFGVDAFPDRKFPAKIRDVRFASETIQGVVTYKAVLSIDNSELLLRPGMTATAEIRVTEIADALLVPNAALRYSPQVAATAPSRSLLRRILPGPPPFRPASQRDDTGANRTLWVLRNGQPAALKVRVGPSDGKRTQITGGQIQPGQAVVIDQSAAKS